MENKKPLLGLTKADLTAVVVELGMPKFTGGQLAEWIYKKRVTDIADMTNLSVKNRALLAEQYCVGRAEPTAAVQSVDGTSKYLFPTAHGAVESVMIPEEDRATLCVSCQVGCKMNCLFCMTGKQGFNGNLTAAEILNQILSVPESEKLTNVVFMGMGEPFDNTLELLRTLEVMTAEWGFAWSPRRITVSTVGLIPGMKQFLNKSQAHLAVSLHNPFREERMELIPAEKSYPIERVVEELKRHDFSHQRRVSFEYIVFEGKNDTQRHAAALVRLLKGLDCRINLIRFHAIPGIDLKSPSEEKMVWLRDYLSDNGIITTIRRSRGEDILAACGMLSGKEQQGCDAQ